MIGTAHYVDLSRLSCQLRCFGDVTVDLQEQIEKEKRASEKPKDRMARADGKESQAILGGILDNVVAADVEVETEEEVEKVAVKAFEGDPNLDKKDAFYGDFYTGKNKKKNSKNRNRNRNRNKKGGDGQKQHAKGPQNSSNNSEQGDKPKRKRNRRRRKPGGGQGSQNSAPKGNS